MENIYGIFSTKLNISNHIVFNQQSEDLFLLNVEINIGYFFNTVKYLKSYCIQSAIFSDVNQIFDNRVKIST